jgi:hypothetical protein
MPLGVADNLRYVPFGRPTRRLRWDTRSCMAAPGAMDLAVSMSDDTPPERFSLNIEHLQGEAANHITLLLLSEYGLASIIVSHIRHLLPDATKWRLTITGDIAKSINTIEQREGAEPYTVDRGAGTVGARVVRQPDDTFDIVISDVAFTSSYAQLGDVDAVVAHAQASAAHIALHEAGHVAIYYRNEDVSHYQDLPRIDRTAWTWRKHLAAHMEDNRIEQLTKRLAPNPVTQTDHIDDAISHLRAEYNAARDSWTIDIGASFMRTLNAANSLIRVFAYLAAELGLDELGEPVSPSEPPAGWSEYVAPSWHSWSSAFHRLRPADEAMSPHEQADVLSELCVITMAWLESTGIEYKDDDDGSSMHWTRERY